MRAEGHNFTSWDSNATFLFNGASMLLPDNVGRVALDLVGQSFTFAHGGSFADQFYLASMSVAEVPAQITVPEPGSLALLLAGLCALHAAAPAARAFLNAGKVAPLSTLPVLP